MAHTKSQKAAARVVNIVGKRRGVKRFGGQFVKAGEIIIRQVGTQFHAGHNAGLGKDFTIFAKAEGVVTFRTMTGHHQGQKFVDIMPAVEVAAADKPAKKEKAATKAEKPAKKEKK